MSLVLVADDEPAVLEVLSEVVLDLGHEVVRAYDGREALQLARTHVPQLIITDHMMPRLSGADLCRQLRREEALRHVPVILLSAALTEGIPEAQAFLPKPFELSEFEALVRRTLLEAAPRAEARPADGASAGGEQEALVSHVAQGMRSPLTSARGYLEQLRETLRRAGAADATPLHQLAGELDSLERMVQSLLDAAQLAEGQVRLERERADLAALLKRAVAEWQERRPGYTIDVSLPHDAVEASYDGPRLRQVVDALLDNALRHTGLTRRVEVALSASPELATLTVKDFGRGIPAAEQKALFTRGAGPAGPSGGRGLGLFIASELARLHGGALSVHSAAGEGSSFRLHLPREG